MDLTFRVLWFEDVDEWYGTTSRRVTKYVKNKNFKIEITRIERASEFKLSSYKLENFDLLLVDYELEKVREEDKTRTIYGSEIIQAIREGKFVNDILFYSSHGFEIISNVMKDEGLQGVFMADRNNEEFLEMVKLLVDKAVRKADNLINIRGIVMDATSGFDTTIQELIRKTWPQLGNSTVKIANDIKKKILAENVKTAEKLDRKYPEVSSENIGQLLDERDFSAIRQARLLSWCIEASPNLKEQFLKVFRKNMRSSEDSVKFFERYKADIIDYRNALAHVKNVPSLDDKIIIGEVDGKKIKFDRELCDTLRKRLLCYESILDEMNIFLESSISE